jgi:hypothetical protein
MIETTIAIALIIGIVEAFKRAFTIPKRFIPLLSLLMSIVYVLIFKGEVPLTEALFTGIVIGLSASGLYSGGKTAIKG